MKVQVDELCVFIGFDRLAQAKPPRAALVEELDTEVAAEAILRALQADQWQKELKLHRLVN